MPADSGLVTMRAEASAWLARLHSEERTDADERGFQRWLAEDARHREVFETLTALWETAASIPYDPPPVHAPVWRRREVLAGTAGVAVAGLIGFGTLKGRSGRDFETGRGEQRSILLPDQSRLVLDTDTKVRVAYSGSRRLVELENGRAYFDVAKDAARPFIVQAGEKQVTALGTAFDVAQMGGRTAVVLVEGKVAVRDRDAPSGESDRVMQPGDRLTFARQTLVSDDRPDLAAATAWQDGKAVFDDIPLQQAVAVLNRYETHPIVIVDPEIAAMHVSGVYRTGDARSFATSISVLLPVRVREGQDALLLSKDPARTAPPHLSST